jgi:hypothetical protein
MPSISRRRLLAGSAALGTAATLGFGALAPASALPDGVAKTRASLRPVPQVRAKPSVTDAHVADAIADVESMIDRAEAMWSRVVDPDAAVDSLPGLANPDRSIDTARDYVENARSHDGWDALVDVRIAASYAGEAIGGARLALDEADGGELAANGREILDAASRERSRMTYAVADASVGFAQLYFVERLLYSARLNSFRGGVYAGQSSPTTNYSDHDVVRTWGSHMQARRALADAVRLYDDHRDRVGDDASDLTAHVESAEATIREEAKDRALTTDEADARRAAIDDLPAGPGRAFRWQTYFYVHNGQPERPAGLVADLPLYRAVENAEFVLGARALAEVQDRELLAPDADDVPGALLDETKAAALDSLDDLRSEASERPLLELLLEEGRRLVWAGDTDLDGDVDVEHPRARALADYALGDAYLDALPDVLATLEEPRE